MDEIAINIEGVSKSFKLPHEKQYSLKGVFLQLFRRNKIYERQQVLKGINFQVKKGEFFGIVGRNGSGKSTLLKLLAEIYQPSKGSIKVNGKLTPFIELGVGFNPELTGRENVYLNGALLGFSRKEMDEMYGDIVRFAELERFMDQRLKNYSSGMQVRLAFSIAVRAQSDILLIDEVLAVGDANFQRKCFSYFRSLKRDKKTVVFVSHDMTAIREYCDRALLIDNGKVVDMGLPENIANEYAQIFMDQTLDTDKEKSKSGKRWGTKEAVYDRIKIIPGAVSVGKDIAIDARVLVKENIEDVVFGFSVKNEGGQILIGTNTKILNKRIGNLVKNSRLRVKWTIPNTFNDGKYFVDLAIVQGSGVSVLDWWEEVGKFIVLRNDNTPYLLNPPTKFEIVQEARGAAQAQAPEQGNKNG